MRRLLALFLALLGAALIASASLGAQGPGKKGKRSPHGAVQVIPKGPPPQKPIPADAVAVIPQAPLNGIPQEPVVIRRNKPDFGPGAREITFEYALDEDGNPVPPGTRSLASAEARVGACTLWISTVYKIGQPYIHAEWGFTCSHDTVFGLDSCIYRGDWHRMGCNHPRNAVVYGGFWTMGGTTTYCSDSTWRYTHWAYVFSAYGATSAITDWRWISC
jgi:hypothetical protein